MSDDRGMEDGWEQDARIAAVRESFIVDIEGFEGPLDILLALARDQKVDLIHVSMLALADQYLGFIARARRSNLELAADYLVMAAWLAYLKSRLLLPDLKTEDEPTGAQLAEALAFQLRRLQAMQDAGRRLLARARLGEGFFPRGAPETFADNAKPVFEASLYDLLKAYGDQVRRKSAAGPLHIETSWQLSSVEDALERLRALVGYCPDWKRLAHFLPETLKDPLAVRSALAATFSASLELAKQGKVTLRQDGAFEDIYIQSTVREVSRGAPAKDKP
ncbi:segregation and condensation protein A [Varunaivibrio sulfuroxidans]|uniref:Segregation and condensation protein A n=1 Tax=Varunaivibrio sulfuroxidans TaxID=1773489 RepID=A0A4R3J7F9_9PROT|nr:ScpA family protein [Varunaivibrio sulfuroxidans]TCS61324.1 condensin subunit ScpA [Varunaivibrio sulfuroxidans]WES31063.1 ScpA family protein [Varunaivibrio sulfuroxidans]